MLIKYHKNDHLIGLDGLVTEHSINDGKDEFQKLEENASLPFITIKRLLFPFRFLGSLINESDDGINLIHYLHIKKLTIMDRKNIDEGKF